MTAQQALDAAFSHSLKEAPGGVTIDEPTEGIDLVNTAVSGLFLFGLRFNPAYFGDTASPAGSDGVWTIPANALAVYHRENGSGARVHVVPYDQRTAAQPEPAVYLLGRTYRGAGNTGDPSGSDPLTLFFARAPVPVADLEDPVDPLLGDDFLRLLALEIAIHLAIKDDRETELGQLPGLRNDWALRWAAFLESYSIGETRIHDRQFLTPSVVAAMSILAGNSAEA